ncbi:MAG TPA: hypothetical protein VLA56_10405, partial [Pseudomonadales bacterium]|nr:hypothetical protein [Pseudomonadales bacterium]
MSFEAQEQALFDLLFDAPLRERFRARGGAALDAYDLDEAEVRDFLQIRPDALELDARLRTSMVLSQLCVAFPVTFAMLSSLGPAAELLQQFVDPATMRAAPVLRAAHFGSRLRDALAASEPEADDPLTGMIAFLDAELAMAWRGAELRREVIDGAGPPAPPAAIDGDWQAQPIRLAPQVSAVATPVPYSFAKSLLCPVSDRELWRHLAETPTTADEVAGLLAMPDPRLLVARAALERDSRCEPDVSQQTVELSEGFAPLLRHADGTRSTTWIL